MCIKEWGEEVLLSWLLLTRGLHSAGAEQLKLLYAEDVVLIFFKIPHADLAMPSALSTPVWGWWL